MMEHSHPLLKEIIVSTGDTHCTLLFINKKEKEKEGEGEGERKRERKREKKRKRKKRKISNNLPRTPASPKILPKEDKNPNVALSILSLPV